jgi:hypothetical protein
VLSLNGPGFTSKAFTGHLSVRGIRHHRIPPRSPNHNAVCERFQGTALQEFYRPAFHGQHFARLADLNAQFRPGCSTTTPDGRTAATSCAAAPPTPSWRATYDDRPKGPPDTSTRALEGLGLLASALVGLGEEVRNGVGDGLFGRVREVGEPWRWIDLEAVPCPLGRLP